jgi:phosphate:Na+ symporter
MGTFQLAATVIAAVMLFLHSLQSFSREVRVLGRDRLRLWLATATGNRFYGFALGAVFTAIVQSSSAVSALTIALINGGMLSFTGSLAVLLGAKVGTTITAWLVSFKLTGIGAFAIIAGTVISMLPYGARVVGKSVFYFGLIFLSLDLISTALKPFQHDPRLIEMLLLASTPWVGVMVGAVVTALLQSSSVTAGLSVLLVQQGVLDPTAAIAIVIGANVGTCATSLIASLPMEKPAKRAALAYLLFNTTGAVLILPFIRPFAAFALAQVDSPAVAVALAQLLFNLATAAFFLPLLGPIGRMLDPGHGPDLLKDTPRAQASG